MTAAGIKVVNEDGLTIIAVKVEVRAVKVDAGLFLRLTLLSVSLFSLCEESLIVFF